jgi:lysophospholipase L1-like esterase
MKLSTVYRASVISISAIALLAIPTATTNAMASSKDAALQLQQHGQSTYSLKYVALGDSVAAGLGYNNGQGTDEDKACGRSQEAYVYDVANKLNAKLSGTPVNVSPTNVSCQGATTRNLLESQTVNGVTAQPQLNAAFKNGTPNLLTITSGANDVHWASFIGACFTAANCDTPQNTAAVQNYINAMSTDMKTALQNIKQRSAFIPPIVVATGYYTPVSAACSNANFTPAEIAWVQNATAELNTAIRNSTQGSYWFARFAPVDFTNHDICSADSWIQRPGESAPFHPTPKGQEVLAQSVLAAIGIH